MNRPIDPAVYARATAAATQAFRYIETDDSAVRTLLLAAQAPESAFATSAAAVREWACKLQLALRTPPAADGLMLPVDAALAATLEALGEHGREAATLVRERSAQRWKQFESGEIDTEALYKLWLPRADTVPDFAAILAASVVQDCARAAPPKTPTASVAAERPTLDQPGVALGVIEVLTSVHRPRARLHEQDGARHVVGSDGRAVAEVKCPEVDWMVVGSFVQRGVGLLGGIRAHRLIRWQVRTAYEQDRAGKHDPSRIQLPGGWGELAELACGSRSGATRKDVHDLVMAQAYMRFTSSTGVTGNLLSYADHARSGRNLVVLTIGDMLLPRFVSTLDGRSHSSVRARRLVPVLDLPPLVGRGEDHGSQALLQWLLLIELRNRATELATGGVILDAATWERLACMSGLPRALLDRVRNIWVDGDGTTPPFLVKVGDRYNLGPVHAGAHALLLEGAKRSAKGKTGGDKSGRKREAQRDRLHP